MSTTRSQMSITQRHLYSAFPCRSPSPSPALPIRPRSAISCTLASHPTQNLRPRQSTSTPPTTAQIQIPNARLSLPTQARILLIHLLLLHFSLPPTLPSEWNGAGELAKAGPPSPPPKVAPLCNTRQSHASTHAQSPTLVIQSAKKALQVDGMPRYWETRGMLVSPYAP